MKKCYLHIGNFKTGSTSLQAFFYLNKKVFENLNFQFIEEKNFFKESMGSGVVIRGSGIISNPKWEYVHPGSSGGELIRLICNI